MVLKGLRERPPSSYTLKMESFNKLTNSESYESRPFTVGGYKWTLVVYPEGNEKDGGSGYLSLYVAIDKSTPIDAQQEVHVDLRFYVYNKNEKKYFTIQDTDAWRFSVLKTMWGFSQVMSVDKFKDTNNGYLYDGDQCEFGVDVIIPSLFVNYERFSVAENFQKPRYTWTIQGFSKLPDDIKHLSNAFPLGGRNWKLQVCPNGLGKAKGSFLSVHLFFNDYAKLRPYEKVYVRAKLRLLGQLQLGNVEKQINNWYRDPKYGSTSDWGHSKFVSLTDVKDPSKGFVVNDNLQVQVEIEAISTTKYFP